MTDREKMIEIIKQASEQAYADFHELFREGVRRVGNGEISRFTNHDVRPTYDEILADKLIEAGFGNIEDYQHRAEVAERALEYAVDDLNYCCDDCPCDVCTAEIRGSQECLDCIANVFKKYAEREIKEERK